MRHKNHEANRNGCEDANLPIWVVSRDLARAVDRAQIAELRA